MHTGEKVKLLKPKGTYLHIAPEDPLGPPFREYEVFFYREYFLKHLLCPPLNATPYPIPMKLFLSFLSYQTTRQYPGH